MKMRLLIRGLNLERLICSAAEKGISLKDIRRSAMELRATCEEHQLPSLESLCQQGGWELVKRGRLGVGQWVEGLRKRWMLVVLLLLAVCAAMIATGYVWRIEVSGVPRYEQDVRDCLDAWGIRPGMRRASIDPAELRDRLEWRYPRIAWVDCGWRGMTLCIGLAEGTQTGEPATHLGAGDVVASRAGIIDSVVTLAGTAAVSPGEVVREGQVLIRGEERTADGEVRAVMARGEVHARVWDSAAVRMLLTETETVYTGRSHVTLNIASPWFDLLPEEQPEFICDRTVSITPLGGIGLPLWIRRTEYREVALSSRMRSAEDVRREGGEAAMRKLALGLGADDVFIDKWVDYSMIEDEILEAVAIGERRVNIARPSRHSD